MNLSRFVLGYAAISLATACAQDITDIDGTYPNKVHKSRFNGTWYFRGTVTEVAPDITVRSPAQERCSLLEKGPEEGIREWPRRPLRQSCRCS